MSVSIALRIANQKPLPIFERPFFPKGAPFPLASVAADHRCNDGRAWMCRARDTVVQMGMRGFLWSFNTSLARFFPRYKAAHVEHRYLALWQEEAVRYLDLKPRLLRRGASGATSTLPRSLSHYYSKARALVAGDSFTNE